MLLNFLLLSIVISALDFFGALPSTMVAICASDVILHLLLVHRKIKHSGASLKYILFSFLHHQIPKRLCETQPNTKKPLLPL